MPIIGKPTQQPRDVQDYDIDYSLWFPPEDVITSAVLTVSPAMPVPPSYSISHPRVKVWIYAGGADGQTYLITVRAITNDGREKEVEIKVKIKED